MLIKIRIAVAVAAAAFGLLALAAPARATEPAAATERKVVQLSSAQAAKMFKVVPVQATDRQSQPAAAAAAEFCFGFDPIYTIFYIPTNTNLFQQATVIRPCIDRVFVTRLTQLTSVRIDQLTGGLNFGTATVADDPLESFPRLDYLARGTQPFTYCPPDGAACVSATFNVDGFVQGNGLVFQSGFFS